MSKKIAGIDYSLTSPAMCLGDTISYEDCKFFFYVSSEQKLNKAKKINNFIPKLYIRYDSEIERYDKLSEDFLNLILEYKVTDVFLEDYAYSASGRVFNIAENMGLLKWKLHKNKINIHTFTPAQIKKFATEKGNASKEKMYESFLNLTNHDIQSLFTIKAEKIGNPVSDIVDAFFIHRMGIST